MDYDKILERTQNINEVETLPAVGTEIIFWGVMVRVWVGVRGRNSSLRDSFSILLRP